MRLQTMGNSNFRRAGVILVSAFVSVMLCGASSDGERFPSPQQAANVLVSAVENHDMATILRILGPSAKDILITRDKVADQNARVAFVRKAKEKMSITSDPRQPGQKILLIGNDRWPFPIPLVETAGQWRFDVDRGKREVLYRRIGDNELTVIDVCRGFVEAQNEYFDRNPMGSRRQYAQKFISSPGNRDGLYWPSTNPNDESPMGDLISQAIAQGYQNRHEPYHGYYFKILTAQGKNADGGASTYLDGAAMTRGFALVAWPSDYRSTGVMTFLIDRAGIVYQKDLGAQTSQIGAAISVYDPDPSWTPVMGSGLPQPTVASSGSRPPHE